MSQDIREETRPPEKLSQNHAFVWFCTARVVSAAGTAMTTVVLPLLIYKITRSPGATASLTAIQALPYLTFGLFAGVLADRVDRRKVMVISNMASALLLGSVPLAAAFNRVTVVQLYVVALGVATAFVWFDAANFGAIASLVSRSQLPAASGRLWSYASVAWLVGPTLGATLTTIIAPSDVLGFDAATYVASALLLAHIRRPFQRQSRPAGSSSNIISEAISGLRFLWHQPVVRTMTLSVFGVCISWGGTFGLVVVYASRALHLGRFDARLGLLYSAGELGSFIAVLVVPKIAKRPSAGRTVTAFMIVNATSLLLLALAPGYNWALPLFLCYQLTYSTILAVGITLRQIMAPDHMQGRVNASARLIGYSGQPLGALASGLLAEFLSIRAVFALMTVGAAAGAALAVRACLRSGPLSVISPDPEPGQDHQALRLPHATLGHQSHDRRPVARSHACVHCDWVDLFWFLGLSLG